MNTAASSVAALIIRYTSRQLPPLARNQEVAHVTAIPPTANPACIRFMSCPRPLRSIEMASSLPLTSIAPKPTPSKAYTRALTATPGHAPNRSRPSTSRPRPAAAVNRIPRRGSTKPAAVVDRTKDAEPAANTSPASVYDQPRSRIICGISAPMAATAPPITPMCSISAANSDRLCGSRGSIAGAT